MWEESKREVEEFSDDARYSKSHRFEDRDSIVDDLMKKIDYPNKKLEQHKYREEDLKDQ